MIYFLPKLRVLKRKNFSLSTGILLSLNVSSAEERAEALYAVATYGNRDNSFTFGLGQGFTEEESAAWLLAGGSLRILPHFRLLGEGLFISGGNGLGTGGVRFYL